MPQFVHLGQRFASSKKVPLSETGTEYEVSCTKHMYPGHVLLQFHLNNTLEDQLLEDVRVVLDLSSVGGFELYVEVPCATLAFGSPSQGFLCLRRTEGVPTGSIACALKFLVKDVDPSIGEPDADDAGYDDEYNLEELEVVAADYVRKVAVADFRTAWDTIGNENEVIETFSLTYSSIKLAMDAVIDFLGMQVCEGTDNPADGARTHTVLLAGLFLGGVQAYSIVNLRQDGPKTIGMRLSIRSGDVQISRFMASSIA